MARGRHRRNRKDDGLIELVLASGWPVAAALALLVAVAGLLVLPAMFGGNPFLAPLLIAFRPFIWGAVGLLPLVALFKYFVARRAESKRRLHEYIAREETQHFIQGAVASATSREARPRKAVQAAHAYANESDEPVEDFAEDEPAHKPLAWSLALLRQIEWKRFEDLCAEIYRAKGIRCETTSLGADGGVDVRLFQDETDPQRCTAIVQCKAHGERLIGVKPVRELRGVMAHEKIEKAFFMAPGGYTDDAKAFARENRITLLDGKLILELIKRLPVQAQEGLLDFATRGEWTMPSCPHCGTRMVERDGRAGKFWGCANFPRCKQILNMRGEK
ncbi:restriction endonuclease [Uliginosibacterium sp. H3]|uniref:Restriction endonuclease n=1 Tax=Uliginosibacterium silvisoli TaxID=3114758 RepID=A0ABU6K4W2_9RHOO|nr:restriction endonuclease [Uliginosibacterium sp. H3]